MTIWRAQWSEAHFQMIPSCHNSIVPEWLSHHRGKESKFISYLTWQQELWLKTDLRYLEQLLVITSINASILLSCLWSTFMCTVIICWRGMGLQGENKTELFYYLSLEIRWNRRVLIKENSKADHRAKRKRISITNAKPREAEMKILLNQEF